MKPETTEKEENPITYKILPIFIKRVIWFLIVASSLVIGFDIYFFQKNSISQDVSDWAKLGDYIGGMLGPLFAGASFIGLIITLLLQRQELQLQREQNKLQIDEMEGQKKALQEQNDNLAIQTFQNSFWAMLERQQMSLESIFFNNIKGRGAIDAMVSDLRSYYATFINKYNAVQLDKSITRSWREDYDWYKYITIFKEATNIEALFQETHEELYKYKSKIYDNSLSHYFRHVFHCLYIIDENNISSSSENKKEYIKLIQTELSLAELYLLFFNGIEYPEMGILINKYNFIKDLPKSWLPHESLTTYYPNIDFK